MIINSGNLSLGSKPLTRFIGAFLSVFLLFFLVERHLLSSKSDTSYSLGSTKRRECPNDRILPRASQGGLAPESTIGKVTILYNGRDPTFVRALQSHEVHNNRHGYPLQILRHGILDGLWSKPAYILAILLEEMRKPEGFRLQWLFWVDADTVLLNPKIPLEIFLPPESFTHVHLLLTADPHGLNNGVFFIEVHPWSILLLSTVLAYRTLRPDAHLQYEDQSALSQILEQAGFRKNYLLMPQRWFNAYQTESDGSYKFDFQFRPGDLLVHFPGVPERDKTMKQYLEHVERHLSEWEIDLASTNHTLEIDNFWNGQQRILQYERAEAEKAAGMANDLIRQLEAELDAYSSKFSETNVTKMQSQVGLLRRVLYDSWDDAEAIKTSTDYLREVSHPLTTLALQSRARVTIISAQHAVANLKRAGSLDTARQVLDKINELEKVLKGKTDDIVVEEMIKDLANVSHLSLYCCMIHGRSALIERTKSMLEMGESE